MAAKKQEVVDAPKKEPKSIHEGRATVDAKHVFTDKEKLEIAQQLAQETTRQNLLEDEKKQVTSDFKAKIDLVVANCNVMANKLTNGYEYRPTECRLVYDAKAGSKTFFNLKTGEVVRSEEMTASDYQMHFPIEQEEKQAA